MFLLLACLAPLRAQQKLLPLDEGGYQNLLARNQGQVVLVNFWATWCAPCREEMPQLAALETKYKGKKFKLITVSCDEPGEASSALRFLEEHRIPAPVYLKQAASDDHFIGSVDDKWSGALPALFLYDRKGQKTRAFIGATDMKTLEDSILDLL